MNILYHPLDPQAQSDLQLMNDVTSFISNSEDQAPMINHVGIPIFHEINRIAADHVRKAREKAPKYTKRSRAKSRNSEDSNTESDESNDEDHNTEEPWGSSTASEV